MEGGQRGGGEKQLGTGEASTYRSRPTAYHQRKCGCITSVIAAGSSVVLVFARSCRKQCPATWGVMQTCSMYKQHEASSYMQHHVLAACRQGEEQTRQAVQQPQTAGKHDRPEAAGADERATKMQKLGSGGASSSGTVGMGLRVADSNVLEAKEQLYKVRAQLAEKEAQLAEKEAMLTKWDPDDPDRTFVQSQVTFLQSQVTSLQELILEHAKIQRILMEAVHNRYTKFFRELCTAKEHPVDPNNEHGPAVLDFQADVSIPGGVWTAQQVGQGKKPKLLVRQCWRDFSTQILKQFATLLIGTPGIGKSVFALWFIRFLVEHGYNVVYRQEEREYSYLYQPNRDVMAGAHKAFDHLHDDPNTWRVFDGMVVISDLSRNPTLVVSSPNRTRYKLFEQMSGTIRMIMPPWSWDEILLGLQHVYQPLNPLMTLERVKNLFMYYGGVPRDVFARPSRQADVREDLDSFRHAVKTCDPVKVLSALVVPEDVPGAHHCLLHLLPTSADYRSFIVVYSSFQAFLAVLQRAAESGATALQAFWVNSRNYPELATVRGQVLEYLVRLDLRYRAVTFNVRQLLRWQGPETHTYSLQEWDQVESHRPTSAIQPGKELYFMYDTVRYAEQLKASWQQPGAWVGRTLLLPVGITFPEVDCIMLPVHPAVRVQLAQQQQQAEQQVRQQAEHEAEPHAEQQAEQQVEQAAVEQQVQQVEQIELFRITGSNVKEINRQKLAKVLCALPDAALYILYFVVPKKLFDNFNVKSVTRGHVTTEEQARLDRVRVYVIAATDDVNAVVRHFACVTAQVT